MYGSYKFGTFDGIKSFFLLPTPLYQIVVSIMCTYSTSCLVTASTKRKLTRNRGHVRILHYSSLYTHQLYYYYTRNMMTCCVKFSKANIPFPYILTHTHTHTRHIQTLYLYMYTPYMTIVPPPPTLPPCAWGVIIIT